MFPNIDPKKMQAVMKQMGINQIEIPTSRVVIEKDDGKNIVIKNPSVVKIKMQGQESFQITGEVSEEAEKFSEEDVKVVIKKTNCSKEDAINALEETGDLAEAILRLS